MKEWRKILAHWPGLIIPIIVPLPWFIAVGHMTEWQWTNEFFIEHNWQRYLEPREGHGGGFWLSPIFLVGLAFPGSIFIVPTVMHLYKSSNNFTRLVLISVLSITLFFSVSGTKLPNYLSPALPFLCILTGHYLAGSTSIKWLWFGSVVFILAALSVFVFLPDLKVVESSLWIYPTILMSSAILSLVFLWQKKKRSAITSGLAGYYLILVVAFYNLLPEIDGKNPVSQSIKHFSQKEQIGAFHIFNPSYSFYLQDTVQVFYSLPELSNFITTYPDAIIISRSNVEEQLQSIGLEVLFKEYDLFEQTETILLKKVE